MEKQSEAERLAEALERCIKQTDAEDDVIHVARWFVEDSAAELRRLHSVNAQLLEALELHAQQYPHMQKGYTVDAIAAARASDETSR